MLIRIKSGLIINDGLRCKPIISAENWRKIDKINFQDECNWNEMIGENCNNHIYWRCSSTLKSIMIMLFYPCNLTWCVQKKNIDDERISDEFLSKMDQYAARDKIIQIIREKRSHFMRIRRGIYWFRRKNGKIAIRISMNLWSDEGKMFSRNLWHNKLFLSIMLNNLDLQQQKKCN